jgi:hypothetical protein
VVANWGADAKTYVNNIHSYCPHEYAYAYDEGSGALQTCATGINYTVTFCPSGSAPPPAPTPTTAPGGGGTGAISGSHTISFANNANKHVDVNGASTANGTKIQVWDANTSAAQIWAFSSSGVVPAGYLNIAAMGPYCMDVAGAASAAGTKVQLWGCNGTNAQSWNAISEGSGNYHFVSAVGSNMCLDVPNGSMTNGTQLQIWTCNGTSAQRFHVN